MIRITFSRDMLAELGPRETKEAMRYVLRGYGKRGILAEAFVAPSTIRR